MNTSLKKIHDLLVAQVSALSSAMEQTTNPQDANKLLLEMQEVVHRINVSQRLLFVQKSKDLDGYLPKIDSANKSLEDSLGTMKDIDAYVKATVTFLQCVDEAFDFAKTLALA